MAEKKKCAHPACNCVPANGSKYCSTYCEDASSTMEISCNCGHEGCALGAAVGGAPVEA